LIGSLSHYIIYMEDAIFYATAQSEPLPVDLGAGAQCGGLQHSLLSMDYYSRKRTPERWRAELFG